MKTIIKLSAILMVVHLFVPSANANLPKNIIDAFPSATISISRIVLKAPDIAENGAVVNVIIQKVLLQDKKLTVREIWLFDHNRKTPISHYKLAENTLADGLATRYKLAGTSVIYAVALLSDGSMVSGAKKVHRWLWWRWFVYGPKL